VHWPENFLYTLEQSSNPINTPFHGRAHPVAAV
jgi:hypothetical protein